MITTGTPTPRYLRAIVTMRRIRRADLDASAIRTERRRNGYRGPLTRAEVARQRAR
jgi:hypothetical protein